MVASVPDAISSGLIEVPPDRVEVMTAQAGRRAGGATRAAEIVNAGLDQMRGATSPRLLLELLCAQVLLPGAASTSGRCWPGWSGWSPGSAGCPRGQPGASLDGRASSGCPAAPYAPAAPGPALHAASEGSAAPQASYPAAPAAPPFSGRMPRPVRYSSRLRPRQHRPQPAPSQSAPASAAPFQPASQAAPAPPAPRATVTTEAIQYGWDGVLQALMARRKVAWMVVRTASVVSLDEAVLTLQFPRPGCSSSSARRPARRPRSYKDAHDAILRAIEHVCERGPRTRDMGGTASTEEVGRAIAEAI